MPEKIVSRLPRQLPKMTRVAVTIEAAESEADKAASLRRDLQAGIDELEAGNSSDAAAVFARLKERFSTG
ncbi:MAG TPA: hypothetical protein VG651_05755 [Stellaceae bacterium]|nr:hypothetical protein [Stellaceae bacterium]